MMGISEIRTKCWSVTAKRRDDLADLRVDGNLKEMRFVGVKWIYLNMALRWALVNTVMNICVKLKWKIS